MKDERTMLLFVVVLMLAVTASVYGAALAHVMQQINAALGG